ncbi:protein of unknown function DUF891, partial [hydrothermal vent metagenome]
MGSSCKDLWRFPETVSGKVAYELYLVQGGEKPKAAKSLKGLPGVMELVERYDTDTYRAVYIANIKGRVYVLHCFKKKSKRGIQTPKEDIDLVRQRLKEAKRLSKEG